MPHFEQSGAQQQSQGRWHSRWIGWKGTAHVSVTTHEIMSWNNGWTKGLPLKSGLQGPQGPKRVRRVWCISKVSIRVNDVYNNVCTTKIWVHLVCCLVFLYASSSSTSQLTTRSRWWVSDKVLSFNETFFVNWTVCGWIIDSLFTTREQKGRWARLARRGRVQV